jgi:N-acetylmuramoyl-L-alanine amidase
MTLRLAIDAARELRSRGYEVVLTRTSDYEVSLAKRTALANRIGANLFISIHMNSTPNPHDSDAEGVETYILNNETDASSRRLAKLENTVLTSEERASPELTDVSLILKDLRLDANLGRSKRLACAIQSSLIRATSRALPGTPHFQHRNRGVKQALFHVLLGANMPSVLVEAGFLTSEHDRSFVTNLQGRKRIGLAIAQAIDHYRDSLHALMHGATALSHVSTCKVN